MLEITRLQTGNGREWAMMTLSEAFAFRTFERHRRNDNAPDTTASRQSSLSAEPRGELPRYYVTACCLPKPLFLLLLCLSLFRSLPGSFISTSPAAAMDAVLMSLPKAQDSSMCLTRFEMEKNTTVRLLWTRSSRARGEGIRE